MEKRRHASKPSSSTAGAKGGRKAQAPLISNHDMALPRGGLLHYDPHHGPPPPPTTAPQLAIAPDHHHKSARAPTIYVPAPTPPPPPGSAPMPSPAHHGYMTLLPAPIHLHHSHATTTAGLSAGSLPIYTAPMPLHTSLGIETTSPILMPTPVLPRPPGPVGPKADALTHANIQDLLKQQPPRPVAPSGPPYHHVYAYHHAAQDGTVAMAAPPMVPLTVAPAHVAYPAPYPPPYAANAPPPPPPPTTTSSSKDEEKKRQKRALNRQSAQRCRKRKRAMLEELQSANELFSTHAAILESLCSTNLAFMYRTGTITYVQGTRRLGFQPEELEAQDMYSLLEPSSCVRVKQLLSQLIDDWENTTNEQESGSSNQDTPTGSDNGANEGQDANGMTYQRSNGSDGSEGSDTSMFEEEQAQASAANGSAEEGHAPASTSANATMATSTNGSGRSGRAVATAAAAATASTNGNGQDGSADGGSSSPSSSNSPPPSPGGTSGAGANGSAPTASSSGSSSRGRSTENGNKSLTNGSSTNDGSTSNPSSSANGSSCNGGSEHGKRFTSKEPGSSTNSNISQLLPYGYPHGHPMSSEFTYQIRNLSFVTRDGSTVSGDVHGVITLDESLGKEPECIWSVRFQRDNHHRPTSSSPLKRKLSACTSAASAVAITATSPQAAMNGIASPSKKSASTSAAAVITENSYTSSSDDSPPTSSGESPPPRVTHGSSKVPTGYSGSKVSSSSAEPTSSEGSMDVSNEDDSDD